MTEEINFDLTKLEQEYNESKKEASTLFDEDGYLKTFKDIQRQFINILEKRKEIAYQKAYDLYMSSPDALLKLAEAEEDKSNGELKKKKVIHDAVKEGNEAKKKVIPNTPLKCAEFLKKYIRFIRIKPEGQGQRAPLHFYDPDSGIYLEDDEFLHDLMVTIHPNITERQGNDALYKIAHSVPLKDNQENFVVVGQELYNNVTGELTQFDPRVIVTRKVRMGYNPNATEPNIDVWKPTEWLQGLFDNDRDSYDLAIQIIRATITGKTLENIFWLYGEGGTGKGTFQTLLENLVGSENVASFKIDGASGKFDTSILIGKTVVIGDDIQKDVVIKDTSVVFSLATGNPIRIEDKGKRPYTTRKRMTVVQSSNGFPRMNADQKAINRRFRVLTFSELKGKADKRIKNNYVGRKEVLEYFVKLAIETPFRDVNPQKSIEFLDEAYKEMNPVADFVDRFFNDDIIKCNYVPNGYVFECFKAYCEKNQNRNYFLNDRTLHKQIKKILPKSFRPKQVTIKKGQKFYEEFNPHLVSNPWHFDAYDNGRNKKEDQAKAQKERGYGKI